MNSRQKKSLHKYKLLTKSLGNFVNLTISGERDVYIL